MRLSTPCLGLALAASLVSTVAAHATTIVYANSSTATAVDGLVVDGVTYNVTFSTTGSTTFENNASGASDAAQALVTALNSSTATQTDVSSEFSVATNGPDADGGPIVQFGDDYGFNTTTWQLGGYQSTNAYSADFTLATATPPPTAATPEPSTLALLGTGVLGIAGSLRRRLA